MAGPGDSTARRRLAAVWLGGGWALNLVWEVAQGPLYEGHAGWGAHLWFCVRASLADVLIVAGLFGFMAAAAADLGWYRSRVGLRLVALAAAGAVTAVAIELRALDLGKWTYAETMPLVPVLDVGLSPVAQMVLIPVALTLASRRWANGGK